ncbi:PIN domain-containing protein [Rhodobacteraceae bacterium NNCM2]|nr:PIN domain-containing protein [Coraliihabitans acroporae]
MAEKPPKVLIDTCVLFARIPRGIALNAAEAGLLTPFWSDRILEEWRIAATRKGGDEREIAGVTRALRARWPEASLPPATDLEAQLHLPDQGDAHVVAVAAGRVDAILTFNIRDFPRRILGGFGLEARHPDEFFWLLQSHAPEVMREIIGPIAAEHGAESGDAVRKLLKRSLLPRLGKAVAAEW